MSAGDPTRSYIYILPIELPVKVVVEHETPYIECDTVISTIEEDTVLGYMRSQE